MIIAAITFVVGSLLLKETHGHKIWEEMRVEEDELEATEEAGGEADDLIP